MASGPKIIKHINYLILAVCLVETALLTTISRLIPPMLIGLLLRVKSPPQETYMLTSHASTAHNFWTLDIAYFVLLFGYFSRILGGASSENREYA